MKIQLLEQLTATHATTILETFKTLLKNTVNTAWTKHLLVSQNFENLTLPSPYDVISFELSPFRGSDTVRLLGVFFYPTLLVFLIIKDLNNEEFEITYILHH